MTYKGLVLNDQRARDYGVDPVTGIPWRYYIRVRNVSGLWAADLQTEAVKVPGSPGTNSGMTQAAGKPFTLTGEVRSRDLMGLRMGQDDFMAAFGDTADAPFGYERWNTGPLEILCHPTQKVAMDDEQTDTRFARPFTVQLYSDDPYSYSTVEKSLTVVITSTSGRVRSYPRTYPIAGQPKERAYTQTVLGGVNALQNLGTAPAAPVIDLYGQQTNPIVTNVSTGQRIVFNNLVIPAGQFVRVDTTKKPPQVLLNGVSLTYDGLDGISTDFWRIRARSTDFVALTPFGYDANAYAIVRWKDTYQ